MYPDFDYTWHQLLLNAFMEFNPVNVRSKANKAEHAIRERLCDPIPTLRAQTALFEALRALRLWCPQRTTDHAE